MIERINLLPLELRSVERGHFYLLAAISILLYAGVLFLLYDGKMDNLAVLDVQKASLEQEIKALKIQSEFSRKMSEEINSLEQKSKQLETRMELMSPLMTRRMSWADMLYEMANLVPSGVWLTTFSSVSPEASGKGRKAMKLEGMSLGTGLITDFINILNRSPYFEKASMRYANKVSYGEREAFSFELHVIWKW